MPHLIEHVIIHTLEDSLQLLPFLFVVFLLMEYLEHSFGQKAQAAVRAADKAGPLFGGLLGAVPQCGFSVMITNLFCGRVVTPGTLIAVYLSTSDEMLPVALSLHGDLFQLLKLVALKAVIGVAAGFLVDMLLPSHGDAAHIGDLCRRQGCGCHQSSLVQSALNHTLRIFAVIFLVTFLLNGVIEFVGLETIRRLMSNAGILSPVLACLVGLIPNCAASVIITELYMAQAIPLGTALSGLLAGSGVAWVVLFRLNKNKGENFKILAIVFAVSVCCGVLVNGFGLAF